MASDATLVSEAADERIKLYEEIFRALRVLYNSDTDLSEPEKDDNVDIVLSHIARPMGRSVVTLSQIARRRISDNAGFMARLRKETDDGTKDYGFLLSLFSASVDTILPTRVDGLISSYLNEIRPALEGFLRRAEPLPFWVPDETVPHFEFLRSLKIPASSKGEPDMLLHGLGNFKERKELQALVERIFQKEISSSNSASSLLLNTSGSGKTRSLLEGLCQIWGLYFTCGVDSEGRGSQDLHQTIHRRIGEDLCFVSDLPRTTGYRTVHLANCDIAQKRFKEVLLARLCILEFFCQVAREVAGGELTAQHKRLWVFLQIKPSCIGQQHVDVFNTLTENIVGIETIYADRLIRKKMETLRTVLSLDKTDLPLYCVVDEAQVAARSLPNAFMTFDAAETTRRPSLRELARAFALPYLPIRLNISGTAIDKRMIDEIMGSSSFKDTAKTTITHFGAFDVAEEQSAYMKQFLPVELAEDGVFLELFRRSFYWLKGRYRFTAAYMKDLLLTGFRRPHLMLNEYIRLSTRVEIKEQVKTTMSDGFRPTDSKLFWEDGEAVPSELMHFQFKKLKKFPDLENVVRTHTAQFWMRSKMKKLVADESQFDLIACGFARYAETDIGNQEAAQVTLDEPLALLALAEWLQHCDLPLAQTLRVAAANAVTEADGANGLEEYLALYFSVVFDDETPLTDIFLFNEYLEPPEWAKSPATLVSLYVEQDTQQITNSNPSAPRPVKSGPVGHQSRPSISIGQAAGTMAETERWLEHIDLPPICFPDRFMGPDILFVLRLMDQSHIWVALQSKFSNANSLPSDVIQKAIPTVTPGQFYGLRINRKRYTQRKSQTRTLENSII
ncbi:hypothetical protein DFH06DRAFT_760162 [Mycena polygramma]|nr:hypothetical protein DFH06DRAFT_760162 [Mycena polygramma]